MPQRSRQPNPRSSLAMSSAGSPLLQRCLRLAGISLRIRFQTLKTQPCPELQDAGIGCAVDEAKCVRRGDAGSGQAEVRMVEQVEELARNIRLAHSVMGNAFCTAASILN